MMDWICERTEDFPWDLTKGVKKVVILHFQSTERESSLYFLRKWCVEK